MHTFPQNPDDFVQAYPDAYQGDKPVPSKLDAGVLQTMREGMPARKTHSALKPATFCGFQSAPQLAYQTPPNAQRYAALQDQGFKRSSSGSYFSEKSETPPARCARRSPQGSLPLHDFGAPSFAHTSRDTTA